MARSAFLVATALLGLAHAAPASAQTEEQAAARTGADAGDIIVTARKRKLGSQR